MRKPEVLFFIAVVVGLIIGKFIKNFKVAFAITLILMIAFAFNFKKRD